ncbi:MAG: alpha/beta hydrolase [Spirochaetes bacterium]|nr:alpha/beta hydrolase [Spirochaetota bacterium]
MRHATLVLIAVMLTSCATTRHTRDSIRGEVVSMKIGESRYCEVEGRAMHYLEAGRGEPLILIHGWICWGAYWKHVIPLLAEKYHVYAVDLPGHGISDRTSDNTLRYDTASQARRIIAFMDGAGIAKASIVGHSMGGEIAARVALAAPDRVKNLVLVCAAGLERNPRIVPWYLRLGRAMRIESLSKWFFRESMVRLFTPGLMFHDESSIPEDFLREMALINCSSGEYRRAVGKVTREGIWQQYIDRDVPSLKVPTLVASARHDRVVPPELGAMYHDLLPNSKLVIWEKAGHMLPWEQADDLSREIAAFCR